jgi:hypothetical protein
MSKWFQREHPQKQPAGIPKPAIVDKNIKAPVNDSIPRLSVSFDRIKDAIISVENNPLLGAGKITKIEHLTDILFTNFKLASDDPENPVITYEEILEEIKLVNDNELFGAGKFSKREILTDRLLGKFVLRQNAQRDATAAKAAAAVAAAAVNSEEAQAAPRQQKVRTVQQSQPASQPGPEGGLAFQ